MTLWVVFRKIAGMDWSLPYQIYLTRKDARYCAKYYNGFSHKTKDIKYWVKKYVEAK